MGKRWRAAKRDFAEVAGDDFFFVADAVRLMRASSVEGVISMYRRYMLELYGKKSRFLNRGFAQIRNDKGLGRGTGEE